MGEDRLAAAASAASCTAAPAGKKDGPFDMNGHGARKHTCKLASRRKNTFHVLEAQKQIRWEGRADKGNSLPTGNVAVVIILQIPRTARISYHYGPHYRAKCKGSASRLEFAFSQCFYEIQDSFLSNTIS